MDAITVLRSCAKYGRDICHHPRVTDIDELHAGNIFLVLLGLHGEVYGVPDMRCSHDVDGLEYVPIVRC